MANMNCEQFVVNELKNTRKIVCEMQESIVKKQEELFKLTNENTELKEFLNKLFLKIERGELHLCSFIKEDKELLEEIKKYKQEYVDVEKTEEEGE